MIIPEYKYKSTHPNSFSASATIVVSYKTKQSYNVFDFNAEKFINTFPA